MAIRHPFYHVVIAGIERDLRLFEVKPGLKIAILNILGFCIDISPYYHFSSFFLANPAFFGIVMGWKMN